MKTLGAIVIALVFVWYSVEAQRPNSQTGIEGVWRVVEQTINGRTLAGQNLGVGYHIYTKNYSAAVRESDVPPRPAFGGDSTATAAQILAAYGPFVAQFGSYKTVGDQLIGETLVAKNPENMNRGPGVQRFRVEGDTLTLTSPYGTTGDTDARPLVTARGSFAVVRPLNQQSSY